VTAPPPRVAVPRRETVGAIGVTPPARSGKVGFMRMHRLNGCRSRLGRVPLVVRSLAVAALSLPLLAAPAEAASGGGCSPWSQSIEGVSVEACINASGWSVNADGWERGSSPYCYVQVTLLDSRYRSLGTGGTQNCTAGHHTGPSGVRWGTYYSEMCVYDLRSTNYRCMTSPAINVP